MFDKVVIRNRTVRQGNIHLAVHPFAFGAIRMMTGRGSYDMLAGTRFEREPLAQWQERLADALWDGIPGLQTLFFSNGEITLQHAEVFSDGEIIEAATNIIRPVLETNLRLQGMAAVLAGE